MAIPEAPSTYFELDVPRPVQEVDVASGGSVGKTVLAGGKGTRLSAHLWPRSRLILDWTDEAKSGFPPPPLLAAQVEIAIDADLEAVTTRSSWVIRCVRGIARRLEIRLDELDVVQTLKLDDQFLVAAIERNVLTIPLGEAMRPGETRHLVMETRRTFPPNAPKTYAFSGFPLSNAVEQSGAIGITQSANLWINVTTAQGLHRIDPRELPTELRRVREPALLTSFSISRTSWDWASRVLLRCTARRRAPAWFSMPRRRRWIPPSRSSECAVGSSRSRSWFPPVYR